jgi:hypothetical protein
MELMKITLEDLLAKLMPISYIYTYLYIHIFIYIYIYIVDLYVRKVAVLSSRLWVITIVLLTVTYIYTSEPTRVRTIISFIIPLLKAIVYNIYKYNIIVLLNKKIDMK